MLDKLKHTFKHTAIYSFGNIANKLVGILLLPFYTKALSLGEYGIYDIIMTTIAIFTQILIVGQSQSLIRFYTDEEYADQKGEVLNNILFFLLSVLAGFVSITLFYADELRLLLGQGIVNLTLVQLSCFVIAARIMNILFLTLLRALEKSFFFAVVSLLKFVLVLCLNIYFVIVKNWGIEGIIVAFLIGEVIQIFVLTPSYLKRSKFKINFLLLKSLISFGSPLIFSSLASILLNMGNRYFLLYLANEDAVGIYALASRYAGILNNFFIQAFNMSILPIAFKMYLKPDAKRYFSKIFTYYILFLVWAGLTFILFGNDLIKLVSNKVEFYDAYKILPILILGYIFVGIKGFANIGLYINKKTSLVALFTILALSINILLNILLIPMYSYVGSAISMLVTFIFLFAITLGGSQKQYKVDFEYRRIIYLFSLGIIFWAIFEIFIIENKIVELLLKSISVFLFPIILVISGFLEEVEKTRIKELYLQYSKLSEWEKLINRKKN
ncbi:MAG: lipopolysaccharide biosynthesis protein [Rhodothermaceae bacterium]